MNTMNEETTYDVGQVLYYVPNGKTSIVAVQVIEEVQKKTLAGVKVEYVIKYPSRIDGETQIKTASMHACKGDFYNSTKNLKQALMNKTETVIDKMIKSATTDANTIFSNNEIIDDQPLKNDKELRQENQKYANVTMPDGKVVKVDADSIGA